MFCTKRKWTIFSIIIIIPIGLSTKIYSGMLSQWVNNSLGGVFYVVFWSLIISLLFPGSKPVKNASVIMLLTCVIEFLQLYHHAYLEYLR
ncbi:MAG: DUF2809 domain-containing protein, partial [Candidatus Cloacimonetes bacterium]|nr:DUF2809 domain-containing protein [Candidatus Cloacimonadota bacterium]